MQTISADNAPKYDLLEKARVPFKYWVLKFRLLFGKKTTDKPFYNPKTLDLKLTGSPGEDYVFIELTQQIGRQYSKVN